MTKYTNFKFGTHALIESPDMTPEKIFEQEAWLGSRDPVNFWALNANSTKTVKGSNFKFGKHVTRESHVMTPEIFFEKGA